MEIVEAKQILGLNENFTQMELISAYKKNVAENNPAETAVGNFSESANQLYDISRAYQLLRDKELEIVPEPVAQPLIIFTDASIRENMDVAAFGIVANNIPNNFNVPSKVIDKFNIISLPNEPGERLCKFSGVVANYDINSAEIMAILCSVEIFMYLTLSTKQTIVIYTDSLVAKKVLSGKRMPPNSSKYINLRKQFIRLKDNGLDIIIKKVSAHADIPLNELVDGIAKERLELI